MSDQPIIPPITGLTPEAATALGLDTEPNQNGHIDTDSGLGEDNDEGISPAFSFADITSDGDVVDAEIVDEGTDQAQQAAKPAERAKASRGRSTGTPRDAKTGPPNLDEWTGFFSRVVLRVTTEWYISWAFRGIDEDLLTEREVERLALTDDERQLIAVPLAEMSNKSKFMRKHGRMIVASGDAFNAMVVLGAWASRVNRIAAKYRPRQPKSQVRINGSSGQTAQDAGATEGATGGRFPEWFTGPIVPGSG